MLDTLAWIPHPTAEWLRARVISQGDDGSVTLQEVDGEATHTTAGGEELLLVNELPESGVEDMTNLSNLHEPALLDNLRHRFQHDHVYTYTGKICIAVNPFNWQVSQPLYAESLLMRYRGVQFGELPPHVYAIAEDAYQQVLSEQRNQSILISGESGAGKTESVKIMMQYLAVVSKTGDQNKVAAQVLASNPLLEAFGNAKTLRNDNSSRFGKFIEMQFDEAYSMAGAKIQIYLLEKSRVIAQGEGERNYHVFYQLLAGLSVEERVDFGLSTWPIESLTLLSQSGCISIAGLDDAAMLQRTREAMHAIGMEASEHAHVLRTLAAVLLLAQVMISSVPRGGLLSPPPCKPPDRQMIAK